MIESRLRSQMPMHAQALLVGLLATGWVAPVAAQVSTERAGDVLMYALPVTAATTTLLLSDWRGTGQFVSAAALNAFITDGLKRLIPKDRPDGSDTKSFPSGHTSVASQGASFIHFRYGLRYGAPAYAVAAFVGYSRVRADKHYWEDVAVGAIIGVGSSWLLTDRRTFDIAGSSLERVDIGLRVTFGNGLPLRLGG